jgi:hypothetical protein
MYAVPVPFFEIKIMKWYDVASSSIIARWTNARATPGIFFLKKIASMQSYCTEYY